ncbi:MAG: hypothetical protein ACI85Q_002046, partial [Salibacteraceae bacterium]
VITPQGRTNFQNHLDGLAEILKASTM